MNELKIGEKIQSYRKEKGLSIRKLAAECGITASMLSQIEKNQVNPSIATLRVIADKLNVPLYTFFTEEASKKLLVTPNERKTIGNKSNENKTVLELLTPDTQSQIEFIMMVIAPLSDSNTEAKSHEGEEVAFMYSGEEVDVEIDGEHFIMRQGDSIRIPPRALHNWHNHTNSTVQIIFAITPPTF